MRIRSILTPVARIGGVCIALCLLCEQATAANFRISAFDRQGNIGWSNAFRSGVCTVQAATALTNSGALQWRVLQNYFTTNSAGQGLVSLNSSNHYFRLLGVDVSTNTAAGFSNLCASFGVLRTIAGNGFGGTDNVNYWQAGFEGGYATNAALSRPHFAMADDAGNVFIADKNSHAILKVTTDGRIHTVAGTHSAGNGADSPATATGVQLSGPNGIWVRGDGTVYILDTGNSKVRRLGADGMMTTLFAVTNEVVNTGRGLWVSDDETLGYLSSGSELKKWTPAAGVKTVNNNFNELGTFVVDANDDLVTTDRGANKVYFLDATGGNSGTRNVLYGDGSTNNVVDGTLAKTNGLYGVRAIWVLPTGGYLLGTDEGSQVLYVDAAGVVHVFVNGAQGAHSGDGQWFHSPGAKVSEVRGISMDRSGNIYITEDDVGYVRKIDFVRLTP